MSADNGVYILITATSNPNIKTYRVLHCQNIEDIYWHEGEKRLVDKIQPAMLKQKFADAELFPQETSARHRAFAIAREIHDEGLPLEYGISEIHYDKPFPT